MHPNVVSHRVSTLHPHDVADGPHIENGNCSGSSMHVHQQLIRQSNSMPHASERHRCKLHTLADVIPDVLCAPRGNA